MEKTVNGKNKRKKNNKLKPKNKTKKERKQFTTTYPSFPTILSKLQCTSEKKQCC